jgi:hypothetical protein
MVGKNGNFLAYMNNDNMIIGGRGVYTPINEQYVPPWPSNTPNTDISGESNPVPGTMSVRAMCASSMCFRHPFKTKEN